MNNPDPDDVLSDVLRTLRASGTVYFCDRLRAPWEKTFADTDTASFHQVRRGSCRFTSGEQQAMLGPGDLVFVGPGVEHQLDSDVPGSIEHESDTLLLCGYCQFELGATAGPSASLFPTYALLRHEQLSERAWLAGVLDQLGNEFLSDAPGSSLVVSRLTEVLVVELIRMSFGSSGQGALLRALADPPIASALQLLHANPATPWTLESLARHVGLSRAGFASRFRDRVGQPMFAYMTDLRLERARTLLSESELSPAEIASRVGYDSDVAFVRMFKKQLGVTPTAWRKSRA